MTQVVICPPASCKQILSSACTFYEGPVLLTTGIGTNDSVETVIQKFNTYLTNNSGGGGTPVNSVLFYRSSFEESDGKVYAGFLLNGIVTITRTIDGNLENATNLTNLEADWTNRLSLTYL